MRLFFQQILYGFYRLLTDAKFRKFIYLVLVYGGRKRFRNTNISFYNNNFFVTDCQSFLWQFKEIFVEEYYRFNSDTESPVIFDCGANIGTSCIYFKKIFPKAKVTAFEANPEIVKILENNLKNNGFNDITIINKAVWINYDGLEIGLENADASSIYKDKNRRSVDSVRLKDYLEKEESVDMLKIDIEGAEAEVLSDCRYNLSIVKNLFIEFHSFIGREQKLSEIFSILEQSGFRYYINSPDTKPRPLVNRINKSNPEMDLQLNIFAYRNS